MTVLQPEIRTAADARGFVAAMVNDTHLQALVDQFTTGLPRLHAHLEQLVTRLPDPEREQANRILTAWQDNPLRPDWSPGSNEQRVADLREFAGLRWDFRLGKERTAIPTTTELFPHDVATAIYDLAGDWGLRDPRPARGSFNAVVLFGGLVRANLNRPASAAACLADGSVLAPVVAALGTDRPVEDTELALARALEVPGASEQDHLAFGVERAFHLDSNPWQGEWPVRHAQHNGRDYYALAAPHVAGKRPTTAQSLEWLLNHSGLHLVPDGGRVLMINTPIYWIDSHISTLEAFHRAGHQVSVVTAGGTVDVMPPALQQSYRSQHYLQEIKSAIGALPRLQTWAAAIDASGPGSAP